MAKKKKTQLKPIARGFATTSIPKKAVQAEETAPPVAESAPSDGLVTEVAEASKDQAAPRDIPRDSVKLDTEQDGQQFLQIMVDKYQEKTEKESSRAIKVRSPCLSLSSANSALQAIEVDRRTSKGFNTVEVDPMLVEEVLRLYLEEEQSRGRSCFSSSVFLDSISWLLARHYMDHTKEKAVTRLAVTYGILRRLGFSEDWVEQCLCAISGVEVDEALDWVSPGMPAIALSLTRVSLARRSLP